LDNPWLIRIDTKKVRCDRDSVTGLKAASALCRVGKGARMRGEDIEGKVRSWAILALGSFRWGRLMGIIGFGRLRPGL
jgi:hypothetical protein